MALQTGVFENGQWVTRRVGIHDILLQNRQREMDRQQPPFRQPKDQPVLGLLSTTLLQSPVINWIIPARVRHREKNDVIFIGEDFIHLKEILPNAHLDHVCTKADFGSRIRAARVFGEPRKFIHPPMTEQSQAPMDMDYTEAVPPQILVLTLESQELLFLFARPKPDGSVEWKESCLPLAPDASFLEQPGKHLAVDPRSRALAVGASESSIYIYAAKTMPELRSNFTHNTKNWTPIRSERPVAIPGTILKMEFLYPEPDDENHVILLFIYSREGKTRMSCYEWGHAQGLTNIRPVVEGFPLHHNQRNPQLLIPLQHGPSFILVGEKEIYFHQEIMTGNPKRSSVSLSNDEDPRFPGSSRRFPVWTSWARTGRNWIWNNKQEENFYLVREDGVVHYMQVNSRSGALTSKAGHFDCNVASAFASLDVGFYLDTPDVLVASGDMSPGEIVKIGQWRDEISFMERTSSPSRQRTRAQVMEPDFITSIPNWSSTLDLILADAPGGKDAVGGSRRRILATSGRTPFGAVIELRVGLNAKLGLAFDLPELSGVTGIWTLRDFSQTGVFFLLSFPSSTVLLRLYADASNAEVDFDETTSGVDFSSETLICAGIEQGLAVQITSRALIVLNTASSEQSLPRTASWELPQDEEILAASVCSERSTVYMAIRTQNGFFLQSKRIDPREYDVKFESIAMAPLKSDPSCVEVLRFRSGFLLLVATIDGLIQLYEIRRDGTFFQTTATHLLGEGSTQGSLTACQSAVLLYDTRSASSQRHDIVLVCGLRNGDLYTIELFRAGQAELAADGIGPATSNHPRSLAFGTASKRITLGQTPTTVIPDSEGSSSVAFATCGSEFCRLDYSNGRNTGLEITKVWFTDRKRPDFRQSSVSAVCRIPREDYLARDLGGALVCISGEAFLVAQLEEEKQMVPRSFPVSGTPNRVIYSEQLNAMFVACTEVVPFEVGGHNGGGRRFAESVVRMLVDSPETEGRNLVAECPLPLGLRVNCLLDWVLEDGEGKKYVQIVVGMVDGQKKGRLFFLTRKPSAQGNPQLVVTKEIKFKEQVTALARYGKSNSLVVCFGRKVHIYRCITTDSRFRLVGEHELPSPGIYVTTEEPIIHISTAYDSLMTFKLAPSNPEDHVTTSESLVFELLFTDRQARDTSFHLPLTLPQLQSCHGNNEDGMLISDGANGFTDSHDPNCVGSSSANTQTNVVLVADKTGSLTALLLPPNRTHQSAAPTLLEASLPRSVMRLRRGPMRAPIRRDQSRRHDGAMSGKYSGAGAPKMPGILVNDIIGSASDGSVFGISLLDEPGWRLLKFLQNLCVLEDVHRRAERPGSLMVPVVNTGLSHKMMVGPVQTLDSDSDSGPATDDMDVDMDVDGDPDDDDDDDDDDDGGDAYASMHASAAANNAPPQPPHHRHRYGRNGGGESLLRALDPDKDLAGLRRKTAFHIDGDVLARFFLHRDGEARLLGLLLRRCGGTDDGRDARARFVECVRDALGGREGGAGGGADGAMDVDGDGKGAEEKRTRECVGLVLAWLRDVLKSVL